MVCNRNTPLFLDMTSSEGMKSTHQEGKWWRQLELFQSGFAEALGGTGAFPRGRRSCSLLENSYKMVFFHWGLALENGLMTNGKEAKARGQRESQCAGRELRMAQDALRDCNFRGKNTSWHQTLIKFYFWFFKGNLLFISVQIYLIISMKRKLAADGDIPGDNFSAECFMMYKCNSQPFASDRRGFAENVGGGNIFF